MEPTFGMCYCRYRAQRQSRFAHSTASMAQILRLSKDASSRAATMCLFDGPVSRYTLRQLSDALQNILLQWNQRGLLLLLDTTGMQIRDAVDALFHRFGVLASCTTCPGTSSSAACLDDPASIERDPEDESKVRINRICIRRFINSFLVLYRHMHCWEAREEIMQQEDENEDTDCGVKLHHILAASDDFSRLSMHWDLMPGAKLNYVHDFRGLFNCISQVLSMSYYSPFVWQHNRDRVLGAGGLLPQSAVRAPQAGAKERGCCVDRKGQYRDGAARAVLHAAAPRHYGGARRHVHLRCNFAKQGQVGVAHHGQGSVPVLAMGRGGAGSMHLLSPQRSSAAENVPQKDPPQLIVLHCLTSVEMLD